MKGSGNDLVLGNIPAIAWRAGVKQWKPLLRIVSLRPRFDYWTSRMQDHSNSAVYHIEGVTCECVYVCMYACIYTCVCG
jgi:hypothetical protein